MVYTEPDLLGWRPLFQSWLCSSTPLLGQDRTIAMTELSEWLFDPMLAFVRRNCVEAVPTADINLPWAALQIFESLLSGMSPDVLVGCHGPAALQGMMVFSMIWSFGGAIDVKVCVPRMIGRCRAAKLPIKQGRHLIGTDACQVLALGIIRKQTVLGIFVSLLWAYVQDQAELDTFLRKLLAQTIDCAPCRTDLDLGSGVTIWYPDWKLTATLPSTGLLRDYWFRAENASWVPWLDTVQTEPPPATLAFNVCLTVLDQDSS
jgi:hypothetical protein